MDNRWQRMNAVALVVAGAIVAALGIGWWRERSRTVESPRWDPVRFVALAPESPALARPAGGPAQAAGLSSERWVVAVNLSCPHCQEHLRAVAARIAPRPSRPALAALIVDTPERPTGVDLGVELPGGAWWDSSQVWREAWGHGGYGETMRFDASGRYLSSTPSGVVPDSSDVSM